VGVTALLAGRLRKPHYQWGTPPHGKMPWFGSSRYQKGPPLTCLPNASKILHNTVGEASNLWLKWVRIKGPLLREQCMWADPGGCGGTRNMVKPERWEKRHRELKHRWGKINGEITRRPVLQSARATKAMRSAQGLKKGTRQRK